MLDRQAFVQELHALADRFNRKVSDEMARRYYEDLAHMNTNEFLAAAKVIYRGDTFWPAPNRFLEVVEMDPASEAEAAWEQALEEAKAGQGKPYSSYAPAHAAALRAVGGTVRIGQTREDKLAFTKREFVNAFKTHAQRGTLPELDKPEPVEIAGLA